MKRIATLRRWRGDRCLPLARFFVTFALLAFTAISFSQSSVETKAAKSKVEQRGTEDFPFVVRPPKKAEAEAKKEDAAQHEKAWNEVWLTKSTIWLAGVTTALALFTFWLWGETRKLVQESGDTAKKELRGYVALERIYYVDNPPVAPKIEVKNYGQTPAHEMAIWTSILLGRPPGNLPQNFDYSYDGLNTAQPLVSAQMLHPDQSFSRQVAFDVQFAPNQPFNIYGRITYRDIYGRWWATRFCYLHERNGQFAPNGDYNREDGPYDNRPS